MAFQNVKFLTDKYPEKFTQEELEALEVDDYDIRVCDECGKLMNTGFCIGDGEEYYDSEECLHKHYTEREYLCSYYCIEYDKERIESLSDEEFDKLIEEEGDEDNSGAYYTEWLWVDCKLLEKIQKLLDEEIANKEKNMNQLNSILLEGKVVDRKILSKDHETEIVRYTVENIRENETFAIDAYAYGSLAEKAIPNIKNGMTIRVLGALASMEGGLFIKAQHIEFRRPRNKKVMEEVAISEKEED